MQQKGRDRTAQIIKEAGRLFSRNGYEKVTIKQIADECGVTEPAIYRHFESKEAIYVAVLDSLEERVTGQNIFEELGEEESIEALLHGLAEHILDFYGKNKDLYRLLLYSSLGGHQRAKRVFSMLRGRYVEFLIKRLDALYKSGEIVKKNNEITARCFIGMVFDCATGFTLWKDFQGKMYKPSEVISNNIPIYVSGLKKR